MLSESEFTKLELVARAAQASLDKARAVKEKASAQVETAKTAVRVLLVKVEPTLIEYAKEVAERERAAREAAGSPTPPTQVIGMEG